MKTIVKAMKPDYMMDTSSRYSLGMTVEGPHPKWIVLSGQVAMDQDFNVVAKGDHYGQASYIFSNIEKMLKDEGATFNDVIKLDFFVTDITKFNEVARARDEVFKGVKPASTVVEVNRLIMDDLLMEVEVTAVI